MIDMKDIGKIEKACSGDIRPILANPYLKIVETATGRGKSRKVTREGLLQATDSYMAVEIKVDVDDDETEGIVPLAAIRFARSLGVKKAGRAGIRLVGNRAVVILAGNEQASFPRGDLAGVWFDFDKVRPVDPPVISIGLNPKLLMNAAEALGLGTNEALRLDISDPLKAFVVSVNMRPELRAIVMPVRIS